MIEVAGSLWSVTEDQQLSTATRLRDAGLRRLHWDSSDGRFATPGGFSAARATEIAAATGLLAEAHIMAVRSITEVDGWTEICDLITVHIECEDWQAAVDRIVKRGCTPGIAISPQTPPSAVPDDLTVLCMAIVPGTAGSPLDEAVLDRVSTLRDRSSSRRIGIDGGVQRRHAERAAHAGADWLVVGSDLVFAGGEERWHDVLQAQA